MFSPISLHLKFYTPLSRFP
ncbi:unnamed protein product [Amaranthus hypochondriacus]